MLLNCTNNANWTAMLLNCTSLSTSANNTSLTYNATGQNYLQTILNNPFILPVYLPLSLAILGGIMYYFGRLSSIKEPTRIEKSDTYILGVIFFWLYIVAPSVIGILFYLIYNGLFYILSNNNLRAGIDWAAFFISLIIPILFMPWYKYFDTKFVSINKKSIYPSSQRIMVALFIASSGSIFLFLIVIFSSYINIFSKLWVLIMLFTIYTLYAIISGIKRPENVLVETDKEPITGYLEYADEKYVRIAKNGKWIVINRDRILKYTEIDDEVVQNKSAKKSPKKNSKNF